MQLRYYISLGILLLLTGCGTGLAPQNPLLASIATTPVVSCPAQYNFETAGSDAVWTAPTYALGNVGPATRVNTEAECGSWSLMEQMNLSGVGIASNYGLLLTVLPQAVNFNGRTLSCWVMFNPPPPATLGVTMQFIDHTATWVPTQGNPPFIGLHPGWNLLQREFSGSQVQDVMSLNFQVAVGNGLNSNGANGVPYAGTMWIDEISW